MGRENNTLSINNAKKKDVVKIVNKSARAMLARARGPARDRTFSLPQAAIAMADMKALSELLAKRVCCFPSVYV